MTWPFNLFGSQPEQVRLHEAEDVAFAEAKERVLERAELATVDQHGRRLNERRWRDHIEFIGSLR